MPNDTSITIARLAQFWTGEVKPPLMKALQIAPDDKLDWAPARDMITLGNNFMHIAEASDWWISAVMDDKKYTDYTPCPSLPKPEIETMLEDHWKRLEDLFSRSPEAFEREYDMRRFKRDKSVTGEWIFLHLLEHDIHHRSQINHYLRILGIKPPRI